MCLFEICVHLYSNILAYNICFIIVSIISLVLTLHVRVLVSHCDKVKNEDYNKNHICNILNFPKFIIR